jgi:hypothetical protein
MAASYTTLTTLRTTRPNPLALLTALRAAVDATVGATEAVGGWRMKKATLWTAPQIAAAQNALDTCAADTLQLQAQQAIDAMNIFEKAIVLVTLDQFNLVRSKLRGLGVTGIPDITIVQMIQAIRDKAGTL